MKYTATILALGAAASCHGASVDNNLLEPLLKNVPYESKDLLYLSEYGKECGENKIDVIAECQEAAMKMNIPFEGLRMRNEDERGFFSGFVSHFKVERFPNDDKDLFPADHRPNGCYVEDIKEGREMKMKMMFNISPTGDKYESQPKKSRAVCTSTSMEDRLKARMENDNPTAFGDEEEFFTPEQWHSNCPTSTKIFDEELCEKAAEKRDYEFKELREIGVAEKGFFARKWFPMGCFEATGGPGKPYVAMNKEWIQWDIRDYRRSRGICNSRPSKKNDNSDPLRDLVDRKTNGPMYYNLKKETLAVQMMNDSQRLRRMKLFVKTCGGKVGQDRMSFTDLPAEMTKPCKEYLNELEQALKNVRSLSKEIV